MTGRRLLLWHCALRSAFIAATLLGVFATQSGAVQAYDSSQTALRLQQGCKRGTFPRTAGELAACLKGLAFSTVEAVGDAQRLLINPPCTTNCKYGPFATIQPEEHSHLYGYAELDEGRIIAKLFLGPNERGDYKKLGLIPGDTTYWWVRKTSEDSSNAGRSVFVTFDSLGRFRQSVERPLQYTDHPKGTFQQAVARWLWDPEDEKPQGSCGQGCCH